MQFYVLCFIILMLPLALISTEISPLSPRVIILLGPPASGKGTQALRISKLLALPHISTGDLFRENINKNTLLGQKAKGFIDAGQLVPDDVVLNMVFERISKHDATNGYILDGFPRTLAQATAFEHYLCKSPMSIIVLNLDVSDAIITKRALSRQRSDDTLEVVKERLNIYHAQTSPLLDYYAKKKILLNIDGEQSPDEVFQALINALKKDQIGLSHQ
jgi:adenylate kinase